MEWRLALISHPKMWPEIFRGAPIRATLRSSNDRSFIPATFFVWLTTDQFHAASIAQMASRLGPGFVRLCGAFFQNWAERFWILHIVWFAVAEDMERRHRSVFPILAAEFWLMGAAGAGACWIVRVAHLERQMALGRQTSSGYRFCAGGSGDFCIRLFRSNRAMGLGQSQADGVGLLSHFAFLVERYHWALGVSRTRSDVSVTVRFGICHIARRLVRWTSRALD